MRKKRKTTGTGNIRRTRRNRRPVSMPQTGDFRAIVRTLPSRGGWSAPIVLANPNDAYPTWPLQPFDEQSKGLDFAMWGYEGDTRVRCYPKREHLASFRRWDWTADAHGLDWRKWRVHLTSVCGQRHSELPSLDVSDICDILDHAEIPNEQEHLSKSIRAVALSILHHQTLSSDARLPNDTAYFACTAADLLATGHGLPRQLNTIGLTGLTNELKWFTTSIAAYLHKVDKTFVGMTLPKVLEGVAGHLAPANDRKTVAARVAQNAGDGAATTAPNEFTPIEQDVAILTALSKRLVRCKAEHLRARGLGERLLKMRLPALEEHGLVDRAEGKKRGWAITPNGREFLKTAAHASRT